MRGLTDKVAIIAGGLGDLGFAAGKRLAEEGCQVALLDVKADPDRAASIGCSSWQVDLLEESAIQETCQTVMDTLGPASILVNAAARFVFCRRQPDCPPALNLVSTVTAAESAS